MPSQWAGEAALGTGSSVHTEGKASGPERRGGPGANQVLPLPQGSVTLLIMTQRGEWSVVRGGKATAWGSKGILEFTVVSHYVLVTSETPWVSHFHARACPEMPPLAAGRGAHTSAPPGPNAVPGTHWALSYGYVNKSFKFAF